MARDIESQLLELGVVVASVTSARELEKDLKASIESMLKQTYDAKSVELKTEVDADLIGGIVVETPNDVLDQSLRRKINQLKEMNVKE